MVEEEEEGKVSRISDSKNHHNYLLIVCLGRYGPMKGNYGGGNQFHPYSR